MGIAGVALGTLIPVAVSSFFVCVPYTCRLLGSPIIPFYLRVGLPVVGLLGVFTLFSVTVDCLELPPAVVLVVDTAFAASVTGIALFETLKTRLSSDDPASRGASK
jgi:hypothetical protein